jgi:hypothetical protein
MERKGTGPKEQGGVRRKPKNRSHSLRDHKKSQRRKKEINFSFPIKYRRKSEKEFGRVSKDSRRRKGIPSNERPQRLQEGEERLRISNKRKNK